MVIQKLPSLAADQNAKAIIKPAVQPIKNTAANTAQVITKTATAAVKPPTAGMPALPSLPRPAKPPTAGMPALPPLQQQTPTGGPPATVQTPAYTAPDKFKYDYNYLNFDTAKQRAEERFNPLYNQAVEGVHAQNATDKQNNAENAANRGGAHSGLMQDMITKMEIAKQGNLSNLAAQKATNVMDYSQNLLDKDQARGDALRSQMYNEYSNDRSFGYGQHRDQVGDAQWQTGRNDGNYWNQIGQNNIDRDYNRNVFESDRGYNRNVLESDRDFGFQQDRAKRSDFESDRGYNRDVFESDRGYNRGVFESDRGYNRDVLESDRGFNYQVGRDKRNDFVDDRNFNYGKSQDAIHNGQWDKQFGADQYWKNKEWSQMSPAEIARMKREFENSMKLKKASGGGGGGSDYSNAVTEKLPPLPDDILKDIMRAMQGDNTTKQSNYGKGYGQVPKTNSPDSKKPRPMMY